jgi:ComF family protein
VWLGEQVGHILIRQKALAGVDCIVPVPLHIVKERERRYNQSKVIAEGIELVTGISVVPRALRRLRHTPSQTALGFDERKCNVDSAFEVHPARRAKISGRSVLLVDDVITTGATLRSCAAALRSAGATRIIAASVALADLDTLHAGDSPDGGSHAHT